MGVNARTRVRKDKPLQRKRRDLYCFSLLTLVVGFFALAAEAAVAINVSISPPRWEIEVEPGGAVEGSFEVTGAADRDLRVKIYFQDWQFNPRGEVEFLTGAGPRSVVSWLQIEPVEMLIPAGEKRVFRIFGTVPPETAGGDYWSGFFVETIPEAPRTGSGVVVTGRVGGGIFLTVQGETVKAGRIRNFAVQWENGLSGRVLFVNQGDTLLYPSGRVEVRDSQERPWKASPAGGNGSARERAGVGFCRKHGLTGRGLCGPGHPGLWRGEIVGSPSPAQSRRAGRRRKVR